jgi:hypothetical protein
MPRSIEPVLGLINRVWLNRLKSSREKLLMYSNKNSFLHHILSSQRSRKDFVLRVRNGQDAGLLSSLGFLLCAKRLAHLSEPEDCKEDAT